MINRMPTEEEFNILQELIVNAIRNKGISIQKFVDLCQNLVSINKVHTLPFKNKSSLDRLFTYPYNEYEEVKTIAAFQKLYAVKELYEIIDPGWNIKNDKFTNKTFLAYYFKRDLEYPEGIVAQSVITIENSHKQVQFQSTKSTYSGTFSLHNGNRHICFSLDRGLNERLLQIYCDIGIGNTAPNLIYGSYTNSTHYGLPLCGLIFLVNLASYKSIVPEATLFTREGLSFCKSGLDNLDYEDYTLKFHKIRIAIIEGLFENKPYLEFAKPIIRASDFHDQIIVPL